MNSLTVLLAAILLPQALILFLVVQLRQMALKAGRHLPVAMNQQARNSDAIEREAASLAPEQRSVNRSNQYCRVFPAMDTAQTLSFDANVFESDNCK
jgi:hypothetical protein